MLSLSQSPLRHALPVLAGCNNPGLDSTSLFLVAKLFAFDQYLGGKFDDLLIVRLETNAIASLHNNIAHGPARSYDITNARDTCSWRVVSNAVVVGESAWESDAPIRRVHFAIDHTEELLRHSDRSDACTTFPENLCDHRNLK